MTLVPITRTHLSSYLTKVILPSHCSKTGHRIDRKRIDSALLTMAFEYDFSNVKPKLVYEAFRSYRILLALGVFHHNPGVCAIQPALSNDLWSIYHFVMNTGRHRAEATFKMGKYVK